MISDTAEQGSDSRLGKLSVRAIIALIPVVTICALAVVDSVRGSVDTASVKAVEYLAMGAAGWYLGQKKT